MTQRRKKPETPEERIKDIADHPERGMLKTEDGRLIPAVRVDPVDVRGDVSGEVYEMLLDIWGAKGLDKTSGLRDMAMQYITDIGNLMLLERSEQVKSEVYSVSRRYVRGKKKGFYKARGRERASRFGKPAPEE